MSYENPYQAPASAVEDVPVEGQLEAADRGTRLAAAFIDGLVYGLLGIVAAIAIPALLASRRNGSDSTFVAIALVVIMGVGFIGIFIWNLVWLHRYGQSVGKRALKIRIVRKDTSRAGLGRIFGLRMLVPAALGYIPIIGPIFGLVNICFIFRDDRRCIHDLMADTVVVKA